MKTKVRISIVAAIIVSMLGIYTMCAQGKKQIFFFNQDEELLFSAWVDPTFTDIGAQVGVEITKELLGGWVSGSISYYEALTPDYKDIVASGGINFHLFNYDGIKYYTGPRVGFVFRDTDFVFHALVGAVAGFDIKITPTIRAGARVWVDYRTDQHNDFYGDSDAFESGPLGIKNPMMQENYAFVLSFKL